MKYLLIICTVFIALSLHASEQFDVFDWREEGDTNAIHKATAFWSSELISTSSIPNAQIVMEMPEARWNHPATQNAIRNAMKQYGRGKKDLTPEELASITNSLPDDINIAFTADSYQFLRSLGLKPVTKNIEDY